MEVLILSKTKFGRNYCVGGIVIETLQYVRLLNPGGWYQPTDTEFNIGDIWRISFAPSNNIVEPHNEDVIIQNKKFVRHIQNVSEYIQQLEIDIWRGAITTLFDHTLSWTNSGAGFLSKNSLIYPANSVGFWISDRPLTYDKEHYAYTQNNGVVKQLKYKGIPDAIPVIPAGTLLRVSLPKWWKPEDIVIEERCYLQLSGWYD